MIFVTGDLHVPYHVDGLFQLKEKFPFLTKKDYVIVAGDFGGCFTDHTWEYLKKMMEQLPFTLLFVDGNHENFSRLNSFPVEEWNGGKIHVLLPDVFHLMRGQIFSIEGKTFFTLGGAESTDRDGRTEGFDWWKEESITEEDVEIARENLVKHQFQVDYVITHTMPSRYLYYPPFSQVSFGRANNSENALEHLRQIIDHRHWFFGHWHEDESVSQGMTAVFRYIYQLNDDEEPTCVIKIDPPYKKAL